MDLIGISLYSELIKVESDVGDNYLVTVMSNSVDTRVDSLIHLVKVIYMRDAYLFLLLPKGSLLLLSHGEIGHHLYRPFPSS